MPVLAILLPLSFSISESGDDTTSILHFYPEGRVERKGLMDGTDFDSERKYCPKCDKYVPYLTSTKEETAVVPGCGKERYFRQRYYCVECDGEIVMTFSPRDQAAFGERLARRKKPKSEPRQKKQKELPQESDL